MNREETLKKIKENGNKAKEYDRFTLLKGDNLAVNITLLLAIVLMVTKYVVKKEFDFGICAIVLSVTGIQNIHEGATLKKWWMLILGIVAVLAAVVMALGFLGEVMLK